MLGIKFESESVNSDFDVHEFLVNIEPNYETVSPELFTIHRLTILTHGGLIKRIYIDSNHPNAEFATREFNGWEFKNKNLNPQTLKDIVGSLEKLDVSKKINYYLYNPIHVVNIDEQNFLFYDRRYFNSEFDVYETFDKIIPTKAYHNKQSYQIESISDFFIIEKIRIFTYNNEIYSITTNSPHPNSDIVDRDFCLPKQIKGCNLFDIGYKPLRELLKIYNMDNPYFYNFEYIKLKNMEVIECQSY